jgi:hypothetical protein
VTTSSPVVAYVGNFAAAQSTENAYADAFRRLGCEVRCLQQDEAHELGTVGVGVFAEGADLLVYTRTHNATALGSGFTTLWRALERGGTSTASTHLDVFWGIPERERWIRRGDPLFTVGTTFTADGGSEDRWAEQGVNHRWLPPAADQRYLRRGHPWRKYRCDVLFLGSARPYHGEWPWRDRLVAEMERRYGDRFLHVGRGSRHGVVGVRRCPDVVASARVVVGDSIFAGRPRYWSNRVPEVLGWGGALVHPRAEGLDRLHPTTVLVDPQDVDETCAAVDRLLRLDSDELAAIGAAGQEHVRRRHTFVDRAREVLQATLGAKSPGGSRAVSPDDQAAVGG